MSEQLAKVLQGIHIRRAKERRRRGDGSADRPAGAIFSRSSTGTAARSGSCRSRNRRRFWPACIRAGIFYILKWALTLCPDRSAEAFNSDTIHNAHELGARRGDPSPPSDGRRRDSRLAL